ncbi:MAG: hypothetical protein AB2A00_40065 [Myxococcota bacterium]
MARNTLAACGLVTASIALGACCPPGAPCQETTTPPEPPRWRAVLDAQDLDSAALTVWGASSEMVMVAGGQVGNGGESLVLRLANGEWKRLHPGGTETFWGMHGSGENDVWMAGDQGRILHWNGSGFDDHRMNTTATIWGVFAFAPDNVWAVGGSPDKGTTAPNDLVFHYDGSTWTQETLPGEPRGVALLKLWGTSADNLYVVGEAGTIWHRTATGWTLESEQDGPPLAQGTLFSVNGCGPDRVYAAGGQDVLKFDGQTWSKVDVKLRSSASAVTCGPNGAAVAGFGGMKLREVDGTFVDESRQQPYVDLHGAWTDPQGNIWAAGGDWVTGAVAGARREGVLARWGSGRVSDSVAP